jgi:hypothetical protein
MIFRSIPSFDGCVRLAAMETAFFLSIWAMLPAFESELPSLAVIV